jgi:hypothetical protein
MKIHSLYSLSLARCKKAVAVEDAGNTVVPSSSYPEICGSAKVAENFSFSGTGSTGLKALRGLSMVRSDHGRRIAASNGGCLLAFPTPLPSMEEVEVYPSYLEMPSISADDLHKVISTRPPTLYLHFYLSTIEVTCTM